MPLRRTKRSNGRPRPRWKDGSHELVESTHANEPRYDEIAIEPNQLIEPLVTTPLLFQRSNENSVSTRDRIANTGTDARIEESAANGEVRLALRPYGRKKKPRFPFFAGYGRYVKPRIRPRPGTNCPVAGRRWKIPGGGRDWLAPPYWNQPLS